jgi:septal ring factor EnvC (AmiA/AmiB activator)
MPDHKIRTRFQRLSAPQRRRPRTWRLWLPWSAVLVSIVLTVSWAHSQETGVIVVDRLNLRPEPGTHAPPIMTLKKGEEVQILKHENGWLRVRHAKGEGYIQNRDTYVHIIAAAPKKDGDRVERYRQEAEKLDEEIEQTRRQLRQATDQEVDILSHLNRIDYGIDKANRRIASNRSKLKDLEKKIQTNREAHKKLVKEIEVNEAYAAKRLVALYKMGQLGSIQFLASSDSVYEMLQRKAYLEKLLLHDETHRKELTEDRSRLKQVLDQLNEQKVYQRQIETEIEAELRTLSGKKKQRIGVLAEIRTKKSAQLAALDSLQKAAETLEQTIDTLNREAEALPQNVAIHSFEELKGLLKMPVKGKIVNLFGPYQDTRFNVTVFRSGIDIKTRAGSTIQTVYSGRVLYADWFKGYGNMMIIDHGGNYYTVYAHLQEMFKRKGDHVNTGEDIATVGNTGSIIGPALHFEVRHHGKPLDPMLWIDAG